LLSIYIVIYYNSRVLYFNTKILFVKSKLIKVYKIYKTLIPIDFKDILYNKIHIFSMTFLQILYKNLNDF